MNHAELDTASDQDKKQLQEDVENILVQFFWGVPHALKRHRSISPPPQIHTLADDNAHREESIACINRIRIVMESHRKELVDQVASDILAYLTRYGVRSNSCDPLKFAYWFGISLSKKVGEYHDIDRKVVLTLTVWIINIFCGWHNGKTLSEDLRKKLDISIAQNKNIDDFGDFGIYFSFKALAKL